MAYFAQEMRQRRLKALLCATENKARVTKRTHPMRIMAVRTFFFVHVTFGEFPFGRAPPGQEEQPSECRSGENGHVQEEKKWRHGARRCEPGSFMLCIWNKEAVIGYFAAYFWGLGICVCLPPRGYWSSDQRCALTSFDRGTKITGQVIGSSLLIYIMKWKSQYPYTNWTLWFQCWLWKHWLFSNFLEWNPPKMDTGFKKCSCELFHGHLHSQSHGVAFRFENAHEVWPS